MELKGKLEEIEVHAGKPFRVKYDRAKIFTKGQIVVAIDDNPICPYCVSLQAFKREHSRNIDKYRLNELSVMLVYEELEEIK